jgi:phenylacetate-CoA ligase
MILPDVQAVLGLHAFLRDAGTDHFRQAVDIGGVHVKGLLDLGAHYGAERLGCTVVPVSGGMTGRQVQLINDFKPDIIAVTPSYMLAIADEFRKQKLDPRQSSLRFGIFGAEPWTNAMRAEIEAAFGMDATDIYGLSEVIGPGVAQECVETKDGLHIWEDHFYPEVIDPETGKVLPDGEKGELVFTSLTKEAFPIIRYRTRDLTRLLPGTARPGMRRMEKVTGRSDDMILLRGVNVFPTQIEEALLATGWCGGHFIIELTREGRLDEMTVLAEARPESWDGSDLAIHPRRFRPSSRTPSESPHRFGPSRPTRWNARSARPSVFTTSVRRDNSNSA